MATVRASTNVSVSIVLNGPEARSLLQFLDMAAFEGSEPEDFDMDLHEALFQSLKNELRGVGR